MTNNERIFSEVFKTYGNIYSSQNLRDSEFDGLKQVKAIFQYCLSTHKRNVGKKGLIHFDFLSNDTFNALATHKDSQDFVAIFSGCISRLYGLFHCFLSDPNVLPKIGDISKEQMPKDKLTELFSDSYIFHPSQLPKDDIRFSIASNMALVSSLLVFNHEIGHIANCHIQFLKKKFSLDIFEELPFNQRRTDMHNTIRALEWEADEYASVCTYSFLEHFKKLLIFDEHLHIDYVFSVSIKMLVLFMNSLSDKDFSHESSTHPSPRDRWIWMLLSINPNQKSIGKNPNQSEVNKGIDDVLAFWTRHKLNLNVNKQPVQESVASMKTRYESAKQILSQCDKDLEQLNKRRNGEGQKWHEENQDDLENYRKEALSYLINNPTNPEGRYGK